MNKRKFLTGAALGAVSMPTLAAAGAAPAPAPASTPASTPGSNPASNPACGAGPALLTLTGAIGRTNRGPFDKAMDQMMGKLGITFSKAWCFDFATVAALPAVEIKPIVEYDAKPHLLRGPLLLDVLKASGTEVSDQTTLLMRAVDGYLSEHTVASVRKMGMIVATHMDGNLLQLGALGPLWAVYDPDRLPAMNGKTLYEKFAGCPWGLYHIEVQAPKA